MGLQRVGHDLATEQQLCGKNRGFPGGSMVNNLCANAENVGSFPVSGSSPGEGYGNPLQCSSLGNQTEQSVGL